MYRVKMLDELSNSWKSSHLCSLTEATDLFDSIQIKVRSGQPLQHDFVNITITAIKLVEVGPAPGHRELKVINYTEIKRKTC